jgi:hypothetical protein
VLGGLTDSVCMVETSSVREPAQNHSRFSDVTGGGNSPPCQGHHIYESAPASRPASSMQSEYEIS